MENKPESTYRLDGWSNILTGLGVPGRDKTTAAIFRTCWNFSSQEYDDLYRSDGLTRRIIEVVASDMVRQGWRVEGDTDNLVNGYLQDINAMCILTDLIKWARLYGGSIIVMGIADGQPLSEPVDEFNIYSIRWLRVYDRFQAMPNMQFVCCDLNSEHYGFPEMYMVNDYRTGQTFQVHHTRILRMDWNQLPPREQMMNSGWGDSIIESIYTELRNNGTAFANMAAIMQDFVNGVLKIPNLSMSMLNPCNDDHIRRRLDFANLSKSITNMLVLDGDETFEKLSSTISGLPELVDRFMLSLCSVTGIPATLLFGRSPAGFNATGESDIRNYYDMVKQYQESKLKPCLDKLIKYIMLSRDGPFQGIEPENWGVEFTPLWQNTEEQEATIRRIVAETDAVYLDRGVIDPIEVAESRFGGGKWTMETLIDIDARKNGYNEAEIAELEYQKSKMPDTDVPIGPDALSQEQSNILVI